MRTSDEATEKQLEMAAQQGETYKAALTHMAEEVADVGATKRVGDYVVAFAAENAEGMYEMHDGELTWQAPDEENVHIEITACDGADGRFVPGGFVHATCAESYFGTPELQERVLHFSPALADDEDARIELAALLER